ncbi:MAG: flagellar basal body rod modification protein [Candidatus Latescibacteria bacterium ADurb.Bin168]|nr:MAG: flagellar basal body rod modification protein [Candidatus Latescibacteria bacterium ADurb.Bin168]
MKTLRTLALSLAVTLGIAATAQAVAIPVFSDIVVATTWTAGNAYWVQEPITVRAPLTIEPGVTVFVSAGFPINVENPGSIIAQGTPEAHIYFKPYGDPWGGLRFTNSLDNMLTWVDIEHATAPGEVIDPLYLNRGGGVRIADSYVQFDHVTITQCNASAYGGGVYIAGFNSNVSFTNSRIMLNSAGANGGGLYVAEGPSVSLTRTLIHDNYATGGLGGGLYATGTGWVNLTNCTIARNNDVSDYTSGGLYVKMGTNVMLKNTIVYANTGTIVNASDPNTNLTVSYSDIEGTIWPGDGNVNENPWWANPAGGNFDLTAGSPLIDQGDPQSPYDPDGTITDIGATYFPHEPPPPVQQYLQLPAATVPAGTSGEFPITGTVVGGENGTGVDIAFAIDPAAIASVSLVSTPFPSKELNRVDNTIYLGLASEASLSITDGVIATLSFTAQTTAVRSGTGLMFVPMETHVNDQPVTLIDGMFNVPDNPPVWTVEPQNAGVLENASLEFAIHAQDQDNDPITYSMSGLPEPGPQGPNLDPATGAFWWVPTYDQAGVYTVTFTASTMPGQPTKPAWSGVDVSIQKTVTITVTNVDRPPYWLSEPPAETNVLETGSLSFTVSAADNDLNEVPVVAATGLPAGATFVGGIFSWVPDYDAAAGSPYTVTFTATSGADNLQITGQTSIVVTNVNRNPVWVLTGAQSVNEGAGLSFTVAATDQDAQTTLTYGALNLPDGATFGTVPQQFSWTPTYSQSGSYTVTFTVSDGEATEYMPVEITVVDVDQAPQWTNEPTDRSVPEASALSFGMTATDPDGDPIDYSADGLPSGASLDPGSGNFYWVPGYNQAGEYFVTFTATGVHMAKPAGQVPGGLSVSKQVKITVTNVDRAPYWTAAPPPVASVNEMVTLSFTITATDPDPEDVATIVYTATGLPTGATLNPATGVFSWTPTYAQAGQYEVTFTATSGPDNLKVTGQTPIEVINVNRPPVWTQTGPQAVNENETLSFTVIATDEDAGTTLAYGIVSMPTGANFTPSERLFTWKPDFEQAGDYTVTFQVTDGEAWVDMQVPITVNNVNRAPEWDATADQEIAEGSLLSVPVSAHDPDGDQLEVTMVANPSGATLDGLWFQWTPGYDAAPGVYEVTLRAWDGAAEAFDTFLITVTNTNRPPEWSPVQPQAVAEGQLLAFQVSATDADGQTLTYSATDLPSGATFDAPSRTFSWTPTILQSGFYSVTFNVFDGEATVSQPVQIDVVNTPSLPVWNTMPTPDPVGANLPVTFTVSATDPFSEGVFYGLGESPGSINPETGVFTWTPGYDAEGPFTIEVSATNRDGTSWANVTVNVYSRYGDATETDGITAADAAAVLQYSVKLPVEINMILADVTGNEMVTAYDAALILHKLIINPDFRFPVQNQQALMPKLVSGLPASLVWERVSGGWALRTTNTFGLMAGEFTLSLPGGAPVNVTGGDMVAFRQGGENLFVSVIGSSFADGTLFILQTDGGQPGILSASLNEGAIPVAAAAPSAFALEQNAPNPFNPSTTIRFALPEASHVNLVVYDVNGRAIRTLASGSFSAGMHSVVWDARDDGGREVASGTYLYRIVTDKGTFVKRMTLLK